MLNPIRADKSVLGLYSRGFWEDTIDFSEVLVGFD